MTVRNEVPPPPKPPSELRRSGKRLWSSVVEHFDLDEHERAMLLEACRSVDLLDQLDAAVRRDGPMVDSPQGQKAHPAAVEARQQKIALARLLAALRLPAGSEGDEVQGRRQQRRVGVRGTYGIRGAVS
jgi:phage terminase small subunit